jgi:RNA-dependent RNA polymerase
VHYRHPGFWLKLSQAGFDLAGRHLEFLAYSSSALRQHAVWFIIPFKRNGVLVDAESIRRSLGDFSKDKTKPAKMAARMARTYLDPCRQ